MTQEEKQLLLKDLCARLPYSVRMKSVKEDFELSISISPKRLSYVLNSADFKPYLRPMSSMTEEEKEDYVSLSNHCVSTSVGFAYLEAQVLVEWLNFHHFDFRNLIERGLALEAKEGMYKTE